MNCNHDHWKVLLYFRDYRLFGETGKGRDCIDPGLYFAENVVDLRLERHLNRDLSEPFPCIGANSLDAFDVLYSLFNFDNNAFLDFLWRSSKVRHTYLDEVELELGQCLLANSQRRKQPGN